MNPVSLVNALTRYALKYELIGPYDEIFCKNSLYELLGLMPGADEEKEDKEDQEKAQARQALAASEEITELLELLCDYCAKTGRLVQNTTTYRDLMSAKIMGCLTPFPTAVIDRFYKDYAQSPVQATEHFYRSSECLNYIQTARIKKNLYWRGATEFGELEITVNLSKPEKDPKEIAAAKDMPQGNYPKCLLCAENVGFAGNLNHPARQNHRVIPINLSGEEWFFQYSPYVYYNEHCIVLNKEHVPMRLTRKTFERLVAFVQFLPHYFIGSNADLPIVGGSILTHDHFQGGRHVFPMEVATSYAHFEHKDFPNIEISILNWPMSVIRIRQKDSSQEHSAMINLAMLILETWRGYSDEACEILSHSEGNPHNTITPIVRLNQGHLEMDLVLRNNRTTKEHPLGLFHPHGNLHHIKKENIGLIEVMGLAVLPGRLAQSMETLGSVLTSKLRPEDLGGLPQDLSMHAPWISEVQQKQGKVTDEGAAIQILKDEIAQVFKQVLLDAGVYKQDEMGKAGFKRFLDRLVHTF